MEKDKETAGLCEDCNTSSSSSSIEEIKHDIKYYTFDSCSEVPFFDSEKGNGRIIFENLSRHDLISSPVLIPPPNVA